jgi:membrane protein
MMAYLKKIRILTILRKAFEVFRKNDPLRMAGATAFFTTFALPAVLIILIQVFGLVLNPRFMTRQLFFNIGEVVGRNTAGEIHKTFFNARHHLFNNWYETTFSFLFMIFVATTLLKVIRNSLNQLWNIRTGTKLGVKYSLLNRAKSFLVILIAGLLFLLVLLAEGGMDLIQQRAGDHLPLHGILAKAVFRQLLSLVLVTIWFSILFKFLPDGKPAWKTVIAGAVFTGFLFTAGKLILQWLLSYSSMQTIYGASTSSVLLLLFVFYSSFIFYYGACFTKIWAEFQDKPIQPAKHAEKYEWSQVVMSSRPG